MQRAQDRTERLAEMLVDTRKRTLELVGDLNEEQMMGPQLRIVNPPLWEIGHLAWFQERWNLRRVTDEEFGPSTILARGDDLYDSMEVHHNTRWDLPLLSRTETLDYMQRVLDDVLHKLNTEGPTPENAYFVRLAAFHEDMHGEEAFTYTRQTHGLPAPPISDYDLSVLGGQPTVPFDGVGPFKPYAPVIHVNWHEAQAYCLWADRRLPTEADWEMAASAEPSPDGGVTGRKRLYPWSDEPPAPRHTNLDGRLLGTVDVAALPEGDSAFGLRQMIGNTWEWCSDDFGPYPGFVPDPYKEYSEPWFGDHKVLRGGCWTTRSRMLRNTWRDFATPDRRDVFAGFRTCAL